MTWYPTTNAIFFRVEANLLKIIRLLLTPNPLILCICMYIQIPCFILIINSIKILNFLSSNFFFWKANDNIFFHFSWWGGSSSCTVDILYAFIFKPLITELLDIFNWATNFQLYNKPWFLCVVEHDHKDQSLFP